MPSARHSQRSLQVLPSTNLLKPTALPDRPRSVRSRSSFPLAGADRLLRMAEQDLQGALKMAEKEQASRIQTVEKEQASRIQIAEKEHVRLIEDSRQGQEKFRRGQWLGWFLAAGALTAAAVVSLFNTPWQVSVALVGIPVLG